MGSLSYENMFTKLISYNSLICGLTILFGTTLTKSDVLHANCRVLSYWVLILIQPPCGVRCTETYVEQMQIKSLRKICLFRFFLDDGSSFWVSSDFLRLGYIARVPCHCIILKIIIRLSKPERSIWAALFASLPFSPV